VDITYRPGNQKRISGMVNLSTIKAEAALEGSVKKLLNHFFEWVLPGHGERVNLPCREMKSTVEKLACRRWPLKNSRV
jgi:hypothetical protein